MAISEVKIQSINEDGRGSITIGKNWLEICTFIGKATKRIEIDVKAFAKSIDDWLKDYPHKGKLIDSASKDSIIRNYLFLELHFFSYSGGELRAKIFLFNPELNKDGMTGGYELLFSIKNIRESLALLLSD